MAQLRNTPQNWGFIARTLHWSIALLIIGVFVFGLMLEDFEAPFKYTAYMMHKSLGLLVLALVLCRILWRMSDKAPDAIASIPRFQQLTANLLHLALYAFMLVVPLSGWLLHSFAGYPLNLFGIEGLAVPSLVAEDKSMLHTVSEIHELSAFLIIALAAVHGVAGLYHHIMAKDATLSRMTSLVKKP